MLTKTLTSVIISAFTIGISAFYYPLQIFIILVLLLSLVTTYTYLAETSEKKQKEKEDFMSVNE